MARVRMFVSLLVVTLITSYVSGSRITLTTSAPSLHALLSPSLNLRCALEETASSATIIGRSVSSTPNNAKFVISIFVFLNGVDIATISEHVPAKALSSTSNINVTGAIPGTQGELGLIELNFKYPDASQGGNYSCQITAIDEVGHQVIYATSTNVDVTTPTVEDIVNHAHAQDLRADQDENKNKALKIRVDQEIKALNIRVDQETNNNKALKTQVDQLQNELRESKHIEHGVFKVDNLASGHMSKTVDVTFQTPYNSAPFVYIALLDVHIHKQYSAYFDVKLVKVDSNGFSVACSVPYSDNWIGDLDISWLSLP